MPSYSEIYNYLFKYKLFTIMFIKKGEPSNPMMMLNSSSQISQWTKLQLITNYIINLSTGFPIEWTIHTKMAKQYGQGFQWVNFSLSVIHHDG